MSFHIISYHYIFRGKEPKAVDRIHNASLPFASSPPFHIIEEREKKKDSARQLQSDQWEIYSPREYSQDNCSFVQRPDHAGPHHSNLWNCIKPPLTQLVKIWFCQKSGLYIWDVFQFVCLFILILKGQNYHMICVTLHWSKTYLRK